MARKEKIIWILALILAVANSFVFVSAQTNSDATGCCYNSEFKNACDNDNPVTIQACCGDNRDCISKSGQGYWSSGDCDNVPECEVGCCCPYTDGIYSQGGKEMASLYCQEPNQMFVQGYCKDIPACRPFQCSDGINNDQKNDACYDSNDASCDREDDNSEDDNPPGCKSTVRDCSNNQNLKILSITANRVKNEQKIRIGWVSDCTDTEYLKTFKIYRCVTPAGSNSCTPLENSESKINIDIVKSESYEDINVKYGFKYTYKVVGEFMDDRFTTTTLLASASLGEEACSGYPDGDPFCKDNQKRACKDGKLDYPTGVQQNAASCNLKRCVDLGATVECRDKDACEVSTANPFQLYINSRQECEGTSTNRRECFYDQRYALDSCYQCLDDMKCYDYKSQLSCEKRNCHQYPNAPACEWAILSEELGTGVCRNPNDYNCEGCEPKNLKAPDYNEIFGACNEKKSNALSIDKGTAGDPQKFKCLFIKNVGNELGQSKRCDEVSCLDYKEVGACIKPKDTCGIGACISKDNACVKDTNNDGDADCKDVGQLDTNSNIDGNQPDSIREACEADYSPPRTVVAKDPLEGVTKNIVVTIMDKVNAKDPEVDKTSDPDYITYLCVEDCQNNCLGKDDASVDCSVRKVTTTLKADCRNDGCKRNLEVLPGMQIVEKENNADATKQPLIYFNKEGDYTLKIYSIDPAKNKGNTETRSIKVALRSYEPNINYFEITKSDGSSNRISKNGKIYTNTMNPTIKTIFYNGAGRSIIAKKAFVKKDSNAVINPASPVIKTSTNIMQIPFENLAEGIEYDFEFDAEDEATKTQMDSGDACPEDNGDVDKICPSKVIVDSATAPALTIKKGIETLVDLEASPTRDVPHPSIILAADATPDTTTYKSKVPITLDFEELYGIEIDKVEITDKTDLQDRKDTKLNLAEAGETAVQGGDREFNLKNLFPPVEPIQDGAKKVVRMKGEIWLKEGEYEIAVDAHDFAGNYITTKKVSFVVNVLPLKIEPMEYISSDANPRVDLFTDNKASCTYAIGRGAGGFNFEELEQPTYKHSITRFVLADLGEQTIDVTCNDGVYTSTITVTIIVDTNKPEFRSPDNIEIKGMKVLPDYKPNDGETIVVSMPKQIGVSFQTVKSGKVGSDRSPILQKTFCNYKIDDGTSVDFDDSKQSPVVLHSQTISLDRFSDGATGKIEIECRSRAMPVNPSTKASETIKFEIDENAPLVIQKIAPPDSCKIESWEDSFVECNTNVKVSTNKKVQCDYKNNIGVDSPIRFSNTPEYLTSGAYEHSVLLNPSSVGDYIYSIGCIDSYKRSEQKDITVRYNVGKKKLSIKKMIIGNGGNEYVPVETPDSIIVGETSNLYKVEYVGMNNFEFICDKEKTHNSICTCRIYGDENTGRSTFQFTGITPGECVVEVEETASPPDKRQKFKETIDIEVTTAPPGTLGNIKGVVKGSNNNGINDVSIGIDEEVRGITRREGNVDGYYFIRGIRAGSYEITASKDGYDTSEQVEVTVEADRTITADITLTETPLVIPFGISQIKVDGSQMTGYPGKEIISINTNNPTVSVFFNKAAKITKAELQLGSNAPIAGTISNPATDANNKVDISFAGKNLADGDYKLVIEAEEKDNADSKLTERGTDRRIKIDTTPLTVVVKAGKNNKIISEDGSTTLLGSDGILDARAQTAGFDFALEFNKDATVSAVSLTGGGPDNGDLTSRFDGSSKKRIFKSSSPLTLTDNSIDASYALQIAAKDDFGNNLDKTIRFKVNAFSFSITIINPRFGFALQNPFQIDVEIENDATCGYLFEPPVDMKEGIGNTDDSIRLNRQAASMGQFDSKSVMPNGRYKYTIQAFDLAAAVKEKYSGSEYQKDEAYKFYVKCEQGTQKNDNLFDIGIIDTTNAFEIIRAEFKPATIVELDYNADLEVETGKKSDSGNIQTPSVCKYTLNGQEGYLPPYAESYGSLDSPTYTLMKTSHKKTITFARDTTNGRREYNIECRDKGDRIATANAVVVIDTSLPLKIDRETERKKFKENEKIFLNIKTNKYAGVSCNYRRTTPPIAQWERGDERAEGQLSAIIHQDMQDRLDHKFKWETKEIRPLQKRDYEYEITCYK